MSFLWEKLLRPAAFAFEAEHAHDLGIRALKHGLARAFYVEDPAFGLNPFELFGLRFANPLGIAAGFDKNGMVLEPLARLGFGFIEAGTVTLRPQPGNPKPRMFRLPEDRALINRLGFNNLGAAALVANIRENQRRCVIGINIGKNKDVPNEEAVEAFAKTFEVVHPVADYIAINVSSPNTPGLRDLQRSDAFEPLVAELQARNRELGRKPLLVKIAPDLDDAGIKEITDICIDAGIDGMIATNTTVARRALRTPDVEQIGDGGLSGAPLFDRSNDVIRTVFRHSGGRMPIIGVGGVFTANDAFAKISAGASLIQAYTGFVYGGPAFAKEIVTGLGKILRERGFADVRSAVGCEAL
ncbi:MAG: quinone-dependent dihydroorotate dehydrogenase [Acidobacteria bacterium]|nr:quinone-dependent dihydroorotate dehydrogenase [Acidobacteriota bacterium]MCW5949347.1 quinone-dependent dihydroorotate dehydrogenase [Pyrinomonadaceae bacterium]